MRDRNSKLGTYISYQGSGCSRQAINKVEIICQDRKIYVPKNLLRCVIDWYHLYFNHPGGSILAKKSDKYVIVKALPCNQNCMLSRARYVNISKR